ncbi:unnamed protein product [Rhodiola kirilowii]
MEAHSLIHVLHSKSTTLPVQSQPKVDALNLIPSTGISKTRVFVSSRWNYGVERVRSTARLVCCLSRVEVVKGESFNAKTELAVGGKRLAVFVSSGGSNFRSIYEASLDGSVNGQVVVLVTNKPECSGAKYARERDIPVVVFPQKKDVQGFMSASVLVDTLRKYNVEYVLLAGYLKTHPIQSLFLISILHFSLLLVAKVFME